MKKLKILLLVLIVNVSQASLKEKEKIILSEMAKAVGQDSLSFIQEETKSPTIDLDPNKGSSIIERMKAKNRAAIKARQEKSAKEADREPEEEENLYKKNQNFLSNLKSKNKSTLNSWNKKIQETKKEWLKARKIFLKNLDSYKKAQFDLNEEIEAADSEKTNEVLQRNLQKYKNIKKSNPITDNDTYKLIPGALSLKTKNQGRRPTCASFAGVRALELLSGKKDYYLSEQYFYFSSKPKCQTSPCSNRGSWVTKGFRESQISPRPNIPLEMDCPYNPTKKTKNETQIPLNSTCKKGFLKVNAFRELSSTSEIYSYIDNEYPVIVGLKLNSSFYDNSGFVGLESSSKARLDSHSKGHAVVLVGAMKLPPAKHAREGTHCFITTNSWGEGWGLGGHSCLSEAWIKKHLIKRAMVAPLEVETI